MDIAEEKKEEDLEAHLYLKNGDQMLSTYRETFKDVYPNEKLIIEAIERTHSIAHDFVCDVSPDSRIKLPKTFQITEKIQTPFDKLKQFVSNGVDVIVCPDVKGRVDMKWLFKELAKRKILSILIEGGAKVIGSALKADLVDKMQIIIAPKIIGDDKALSSIVGMNVLNVNKAIELEKVNIKKINKEIMVEGYVLRNCRRNRSS